MEMVIDMIARKTTGWGCDHCGTFHGDYESATDCCPSVKEVPAWECVKCNELHEYKEDAIDCCKKRRGD